jgi:hypothetical protein
LTRAWPLAAVAAVAVAVAVSLAGCSSSGNGTDGSTSPSSTAVVAPTSSTPTPTASSTPAGTPTPTPTHTSTAAPTSATPTETSAAPSSASAPAFTTTCTRLTVMVIPGGAVRGAEIAAVQFVNQGSAACTITGVPSAVLLRGGKVIGTPSRPNGAAVHPFTLQPGEVGESLLRDYSTCNAPLSDSIRVSTPLRRGGSTKSVHQAKLRACTLRMAPVGPPA